MARKLRILHVTHDMGIGGTQQVICQLIRNLDKSSYHCDIACIDGSIGPLGQQLQSCGVEFTVFDRQPGFDLDLVRGIRSLLQENHYDIIHCHQYTPYIYGFCAALFSSAKVVFTEHGRFYPDTYSWKRRLINPLLGRITDSIVAISAATASALAQYEWFSRKAISVVYNGVDPAQCDLPPGRLREELGIPAEALVFGTIARFDSIKNIPMMIDAFAQIYRQHPNCRLLLTGDGQEREALMARVAKQGLADEVVFTGYREDTAHVMSMIDVYLLTSFSEGTSMVLLEAMSTATCSVVTRVGGNAEIIVNDVNGLVVESGDVNALAQCMDRLARDADWRMQLGNKARQVFHQRFSVSTMATKYSAIYHQVLDL